MKKVILSLVSLLIVSYYSNTLIAQEVSADGANIEFTKEVHDYGTLKYGADGHCTFEFKNTGNSPLIIASAKGSCGCTIPSYSKEPILPGESGEIKVKYNTQKVGVINKTVTIMSNAVNSPTTVVKIAGNVLPKPAAATPINKVGPRLETK